MSSLKLTQNCAPGRVRAVRLLLQPPPHQGSVDCLASAQLWSMVISLQLIWSDVLGFVDTTLENVMGSSWSLAWIVLERFKSFRIPLSS